MDYSRIVDTVARKGSLACESSKLKELSLVISRDGEDTSLKERADDADIALAIATGIGRHDSL